MMKQYAGIALLLFAGLQEAHAACTTHPTATFIGGQPVAFSIINGTAEGGTPAVTFDLPGNALGDGNNYVSTSVSNAGSTRTLPNHVRFRLNVLAIAGIRPVTWWVDSSQPLVCTTCTSSVTLPFAQLGWTVNRSAESIGPAPANARFNNSTQTWLTTPSSLSGADSLINLQFDFLNDRVYPAGRYEGEFYTIARAQ